MTNPVEAPGTFFPPPIRTPLYPGNTALEKGELSRPWVQWFQQLYGASNTTVDPGAPGAPILSVVPTRDANGMFRLSFGVIPTTNSNTATLTEVQMSKGSDTLISSPFYDKTGAVPFTDEYLTTEITTFYLQARVANKIGWGPYCTIVAVSDAGKILSSDTDVPAAPLNVVLSVPTVNIGANSGFQLTVTGDPPTDNTATLFGYGVELSHTSVFPVETQLFQSTTGHIVKGQKTVTDPLVIFDSAWVGRTVWFYEPGQPIDQHHLVATGVIKTIDVINHHFTVDSQITVGGTAVPYEIIIPTWEQVDFATTISTSLIDPTAPSPSASFQKILDKLEAGVWYVRVRGSNIFGLGYWCTAVGPSYIPDADIPSVPTNVTAYTSDTDVSVLGKELLVEWGPPTTNIATLYGFEVEIVDDAHYPFPDRTQFYTSTTGTCTPGTATLTDLNANFTEDMVGRTVWFYKTGAAIDGLRLIDTALIDTIDSPTQVTLRENLITAQGTGDVVFEVITPTWEKVLYAINSPVTASTVRSGRSNTPYRATVKSLAQGTYYSRVRASNSRGLGPWQEASSATIKGIDQPDLSVDLKNLINNPVVPSKVFTRTAGAFTNNSPIAGAISWTGIKVEYKGVAYTITDGADSAVNPFVYWQLSSPTAFQTANSFPSLGTDGVLVALNSGGVAVYTDMPGQAITASQITVATLSAITEFVGALFGGSLTGSTIQTDDGTPGHVARIMLDSVNGLRAFDASANVLAQITTAGIFTLKSAASGARLEITATSGIKAYDSTGASVAMSPTGYISSGQTAYNTGTGFWLGLVSGTPKFSIGDPEGNHLTWDGSALTTNGVVVAGPGSSVGSGALNIADRGWKQTCAFSTPNRTTVNWGSGSFAASDGTAYSIASGTTGSMFVTTYVYLDIAVSTTTYQLTTTPTTAVGAGKVLVAVCSLGSTGTTEAVFLLMDNGSINIDAQASIVAGSITASQIAAATITASNIAANTITASQIAAATITATQIAANTITASQIAAATITATQIAANTITASNMNVSTLSAISANLGSVTAGTVTGATVQTAATGGRSVMDSSGFRIYASDGTTVIWNAAAGAISVGAGVLSADRGDPAAEDFNISVGDTSWHTLDLSGIVPAGMHLVLCRMRFANFATGGATFFLRRLGATNNVNAGHYLAPQNNIYDQYLDMLVACDSNRKVEYMNTPSGLVYMNIYLTVAAYWQ